MGPVPSAPSTARGRRPLARQGAIMTIVVPEHVLAHAGAAMEVAGVVGAEATGMLVAVGGDVTRVVFPEQVAGQFPNSWVEVTDHGKAQLAAELAKNETYVSRIHSHP